jgi:hypothetical protein
MSIHSFVIVAMACTLTVAGPVAADSEAIDPLKTRTLHVALENNVGYLSVTAGLKILDLSDLAAPVELSTLALPQSATWSVVGDGVVYVAQGPAGVSAAIPSPSPMAASV